MSDISNSPIAIQFEYSDKNNIPITIAVTPTLIPGLEMQFPSIGAQLPQLLPYLTTTLVSHFDNGWNNSNPQTMLQNIFVSEMQQNKQSPSHINTTVPTSGKLLATTQSGTPATESTPSVPGSLELTYLIPGCEIDYETPASVEAFGWAGARDEWTLSFDMQAVLTTSVPLLPFSLAFSGGLFASNASNSARNFTATEDEGLNDLFSSAFASQIANAFGYDSMTNYTQELEGDVDNYSMALAGGYGLDTLAAALNGAGPSLVEYGFTEADFSVVDNALTLTIQHPLDLGPVVQNAADVVVLQNPPRMSANTAEAKPGATITLNGTNFPLDMTTQISLEWESSSSGQPEGSQLQYNGMTIPVPYPYFITVGQLTPNTEYTFTARCSDQLTWSDWSSPLSVTTGTFNEIFVTLNPAANPNEQQYLLGVNTLSLTSSDWTFTGTIPANVVPGNYMLTASLGGVIVAVAPILIAEALVPVLEVVDQSGFVILPPNMGGQPFTLQGFNFGVGTVTVTINGEVVGTDPGPTFTMSLNTPGNEYAVGPMTIAASNGPATASLPTVELQGVPG